MDQVDLRLPLPSSRHDVRLCYVDEPDRHIAAFHSVDGMGERDIWDVGSGDESEWRCAAHLCMQPI